MKEINDIRRLLNNIEVEIADRPKTEERQIIEFALSCLHAIVQNTERFENGSGRDKSYKTALASQKSSLKQLARDIEIWHKHGVKPEKEN